MKLEYSDIENVLQTGIITINQEGYIQYYNDYALDLIGLRSYFSIAHSKGKIETGDIVMIALTEFGQEDGGMTADDFARMGIQVSSIPEGAALLAIGKYDDSDTQSRIVFQERNDTDNLFKLESHIDDVPVHLSVDHYHNIVSIQYGNNTFAVDFNNHFGHMVVVNSRTKKVKFYQDHGYTTRHEEAKKLLQGGMFNEKIVGKNEQKVIGKHITEMHSMTEAIETLIKCASGESVTYKSRPAMLNGISTHCSIDALYREGQCIGAVMAFQDMTLFKNIKKQKDLALQKLERASVELREKEYLESLFPTVLGKSPGITDVKRLAYKASKTTSNVLILGESGTGKSILAKSIHEIADNSDQPFIHVNCNAIPETLLESELFGYEKGSFTGANRQGKKGFFEMAHEGTLFLDEIGDISANMQTKLLQVIQNKSFYRVGGNKEVKVNVRIIAATNKNLEEEVKFRRFREDLYYRINVFPIYVPPLRDRSEDIRELVNYLLPKIVKRINSKNKGISYGGLSKLMSYQWPGNVRELENVIERAIGLSEGENILPSDIRINNEVFVEDDQLHYLKPLKESIRIKEKEIIIQVLDYTEGNKKEAMEILNLKKSSFYEKLNQYGIK